ncbi:MAG: hypothetical protein OSB44_06755 [Verrucomicrobiales bacterium]|nr:hypothetical protein [Verrucomicrobiales bacterium]
MRILRCQSLILLLMVSLGAWAVPPPDPAGVEVVGGVEAAVEPEQASSDEDAKEDLPLGSGDSILRDIGFDPLSKDYKDRVKGLFLDSDQLENALSLIADLDNDDFRKRNEASKKLAMIEAPIEHMLSESRKDSTIEMARRVQGILNVRIKKRLIDVLYHASVRSGENSAPSSLESLMILASTFDSVTYWELMRALEMAAVKVSVEQDRDLLEKGLSNGSQSVREICSFVLGYLGMGRGSETEASDPDNILILANARGRSAAGREGVTKILLGLLSSDNIRVRQESGALLRIIFQTDLGFAAYDSPDIREQAKDRWSNYINGKQDEPHWPVFLGMSSRGQFQVIVGKADTKGGAALSYTTSGKKINNVGLAASISSAVSDRMAFDYTAGNVVVSGGSELESKVAVFSLNGTELWAVSGVPAGAGAALFPGGKIAIASGFNVRIIDLFGNPVRSWKMPSKMDSFSRLRLGRFLCSHADEGTIAEYDSDGKQIWKVSGMNRPRNAFRLENGNILIVVDAESKGEEEKATSSQVELLELSPDGQQTLLRIQPKGVKTISSSARLPNGNTLVGTEKGLAEYTPDGYAIKVWLKSPILSLHVH